MRESKAEPIKRIIKLVDAVDHCSQLFRASAAAQVDPAFQQFAQKLHLKMEQFEFELRTELTRLAAGAETLSSDRGSGLEAGIEAVLRGYEQALNSNVSAHSRAMLTRQSEEMRKSYTEFQVLNRAA